MKETGVTAIKNAFNKWLKRCEDYHLIDQKVLIKRPSYLNECIFRNLFESLKTKQGSTLKPVKHDESNEIDRF